MLVYISFFAYVICRVDIILAKLLLDTIRLLNVRSKLNIKFESIRIKIESNKESQIYNST